MNETFRRTLLIAAVLAAPAMFAVIAFLQWPKHGLVLQSGSYLGVDFLNYWLGGRLAYTGRIGELYDVDAYNLAAAVLFGPNLQPHNFSYPPHILPLLAPFGALSYFAGLAAWITAGVAAFLMVACGRLRAGTMVPLLLISPVVLVNIVYGQIGLLLAGLFVGALRLLPRRPIAAGVLIGVLTVKPQLGLLLPLLLVVERQWTAILSAAVTAVGLVLVSIAVWGIEPWQQYFRDVVPLQNWFIANMAGRQYGLLVPSVYGGLVHAGVPVMPALAIHCVVALGVALCAIKALLAPVATPLRAAIVTLASTLLTPYILAYDLAVPFAALVWYLAASRVAATRLGAATVGLAWALPFGVVVMMSLYHLPLAPLILLGLFGWLMGHAFAHAATRRPTVATAGSTRDGNPLTRPAAALARLCRPVRWHGRDRLRGTYRPLA